jgi:hypothetical protein
MRRFLTVLALLGAVSLARADFSMVANLESKDDTKSLKKAVKIHQKGSRTRYEFDNKIILIDTEKKIKIDLDKSKNQYTSEQIKEPEKEPAKPDDIKINKESIKLNSKKKKVFIAGYPTEYKEIKFDNKILGIQIEMWVSDIKGIFIPEFGDSMNEIINSNADNDPEDSGSPLRFKVNMYKDGKSIFFMSWDVVSIVKDELPESLFDIPAGFKPEKT